MRTQFILLIFMFFGLYCLNAQTMNFWTKKSDFTGLKRTRAVSFTVDDYAYVGTELIPQSKYEMTSGNMTLFWILGPRLLTYLVLQGEML